jgi:hypothetical protein
VIPLRSAPLSLSFLSSPCLLLLQPLHL